MKFADPFVSFRGLDRFKKNLDNLGAYMIDVQLIVDDFTSTTDDDDDDDDDVAPDGKKIVTTKWKFKCTLGLPWKPILSASGRTKHIFNDENRMIQHIETWNIDPIIALKQLMKPGESESRARGG